MCKLCGSNSPLKQSHIIPKFVGRWMKATSFAPYLRTSNDIEQRVQDVWKMELMCDKCENLFSTWETKFANEIFHPGAAGETTFRYSEWFVKFAASLAWRALQFRQHLGIEPEPGVNPILVGMETHLANFLLGSAKHVDRYTQHVYPVSELAAPMEPSSPMINRYFARAVDIDYVHTDDLSEVLVYIKLPMFMFFSVGKSNQRNWLETSRIKKSGLLRPKDHILDEGIMHYLLGRSDHIWGLFDSMSPKSKAIAAKALSKAIEEDPQKVLNSRQMRAARTDYEFYGEDAVIYRD